MEHVMAVPSLCHGSRPRVRPVAGKRLRAWAAAVSAAGLLVGCAPGRVRSRLGVDVFRMRLEPVSLEEGLDPSHQDHDPRAEWFEDRDQLLVTYAVVLPCGLELGGGVGRAYYRLGRAYTLNDDEEGVRAWKVEAAYQAGSRTVLKLGARYEALEDGHVLHYLDYETTSKEQGYEFSALTRYARLGRVLGSACLYAGVARCETESSFLAYVPDTSVFAMREVDFGLSSRWTIGFVGVETPDGAGPAFGRFEAGTTFESTGTYWFAASAGVSF